jgi:hypothetical protein
MQVDLKSECFTPESRPNKDFTRDSLNSHWPAKKNEKRCKKNHVDIKSAIMNTKKKREKNKAVSYKELVKKK